jgi:hypothetical protein
VLVEPGLDLLLEARTRIAELRELDEVLQLEVVDVVDQGTSARSPGSLSFSMRVPSPATVSARSGIRTHT